ncbi:6793_t:CDS:2, partial [Gigaspora margarita]
GKLVRVPEHLILTWQRGDMQTQIDDFWVEVELALDMGIIELIELKATTEKDWKIYKRKIEDKMVQIHRAMDKEMWLLDKSVRKGNSEYKANIRYSGTRDKWENLVEDKEDIGVKLTE